MIAYAGNDPTAGMDSGEWYPIGYAEIVVGWPQAYYYISTAPISFDYIVVIAYAMGGGVLHNDILVDMVYATS